MVEPNMHENGLSVPRFPNQLNYFVTETEKREGSGREGGLKR
jgi:hypothetical protein